MSCEDMLEFYFVHNLLHQELERCLSRSASHLGLSVPELQVLWIAGLSETTTLADLARITTFTKDQLEDVVLALEQDNLAKQVRFGASLCTFIVATDEGKQIASQLSNRSSQCSCSANTDRHGIQKLTEETRNLVVKLKGKCSADLIAELRCFF